MKINFLFAVSLFMFFSFHAMQNPHIPHLVIFLEGTIRKLENDIASKQSSLIVKDMRAIQRLLIEKQDVNALHSKVETSLGDLKPLLSHALSYVDQSTEYYHVARALLDHGADPRKCNIRTCPPNKVMRARMQAFAQETIALEQIGPKKYGDLVLAGTQQINMLSTGIIQKKMHGIFVDDRSLVYVEKSKLPSAPEKGVLYRGAANTNSSIILLKEWEAKELYYWLNLVRKYPL